MAAPELLSLVLTLRPLPAARPAAPIAWWGRAAHQCLLAVVGQADPDLAAALHDGEGPRPFTVSSLLGPFREGSPDPAYTYGLRLTALQEAVAARLLAASEAGGPLAAGAVLELDRQPFRVEAAVSQGHVWAGVTTYAELAAEWLVAPTPAPRQVGLQFTSPTTFRSQGRHMPVPLPALVFGSLVDRWNAFAPLAFPAEVKRYAEECLAITRYKLETRSAPLKEGGLRVGAVGQIAYTTLTYDRYWMSILHVLASFALFAGVGAGTTMGLGQCRAMRREEEGG
jgi:CRISPR-associated endoribonuclease Cas6